MATKRELQREKVKLVSEIRCIMDSLSVCRGISWIHEPNSLPIYSALYYIVYPCTCTCNLLGACKYFNTYKYFEVYISINKRFHHNKYIALQENKGFPIGNREEINKKHNVSRKVSIVSCSWKPTDFQ